MNFCYLKSKRSSLRSQCWMRLFLWFSNTVQNHRFGSHSKTIRFRLSHAQIKAKKLVLPDYEKKIVSTLVHSGISRTLESTIFMTYRSTKKETHPSSKPYFLLFFVSNLHPNRLWRFLRFSSIYTVFENHRKSLIQHCERAKLRLHFKSEQKWRIFENL